MSLTIDANLRFLQSKLKFSSDKLQKYQGMSTEEILKAEAASGNQLAVELAQEIMTNSEFLIELFQLADPKNKFAILMNFSESELKELLPLLEKDDLLQGLMYFTQDKLLKMLEDIPAEQLVNTVLQMFSKEEIIELIPEKQLDKLLSGNEIDKNKMLEHLKSIPPEYLAQMIESVTGEECQGKDSYDMVKQIGNFNPLEYKDALLSLQHTQKQKLVLGLIKEDPKLMQLFDPSAYTNIINQQKQKPEIVEAMHVIEEEEMAKMIQQLPKDLMSMVLTQMDTETFAEEFMMKNPELLAKLLGG